MSKAGSGLTPLRFRGRFLWISRAVSERGPGSLSQVGLPGRVGLEDRATCTKRPDTRGWRCRAGGTATNRVRYTPRPEPGAAEGWLGQRQRGASPRPRACWPVPGPQQQHLCATTHPTHTHSHTFTHTHTHSHTACFHTTHTHSHTHTHTHLHTHSHTACPHTTHAPFPHLLSETTLFRARWAAVGRSRPPGSCPRGALEGPRRSVRAGGAASASTCRARPSGPRSPVSGVYVHATAPASRPGRTCPGGGPLATDAPCSEASFAPHGHPGGGPWLCSEDLTFPRPHAAETTSFFLIEDK